MSQLLAVSLSQVFGVQFWINVGPARRDLRPLHCRDAAQHRLHRASTTLRRPDSWRSARTRWGSWSWTPAGRSGRRFRLAAGDRCRRRAARRDPEPAPARRLLRDRHDRSERDDPVRHPEHRDHGRQPGAARVQRHMDDAVDLDRQLLDLSSSDYLVPLLIVSWAIFSSPWCASGRAPAHAVGARAEAIRDDQDAARSLGKPSSATSSSRWRSPPCSRPSPATCWLSTSPYLSPDEFTTDNTFIAAAMLLVGGLGSYRGVLIGAVLIETLLNATLSLNLLGPAAVGLAGRRAALRAHRPAARRPRHVAAPGPARAPRRYGRE